MPKSKLIFVGVSTGGSSIMQIFPLWSEILGLNAEIVGCDVPLRAGAASYRRILQDIIDDPAVIGALVTAHKIDLLRACGDMFDDLDHYATICDEVSCIVKRDGQVLGFAKDPISSALALDRFVPRGFWQSEKAMCFVWARVARRSRSAFVWHRLRQRRAASSLVDILPERLESLRGVHDRLSSPIEFAYHLSRAAADNDALLSGLAPASLVINATGLGKDKPGSPLTRRGGLSARRLGLGVELPGRA